MKILVINLLSCLDKFLFYTWDPEILTEILYLFRRVLLPGPTLASSLPAATSTTISASATPPNKVDTSQILTNCNTRTLTKKLQKITKLLSATGSHIQQQTQKSSH